MSHDEGWHPRHSPWAIALTVTMATFMEVLDTSIANVALPHIAGDLSVDQTSATWVLTSYLVANAIVLPISGWVATRVGRKRFYMTCVALFTVSSFLCGIAPNLEALIVLRVLQGASGGGLGPSEQSILADTFPPKKRGMAFAVYGMAVVLAPAIGPTLGGFITDHYSWRWIFFLNVPVGIASLFLSNWMVTDPPWLEAAKRRVGRIDFPGLALIALALGTLQIALDKGEQDDWLHSTLVASCLAIAIVSFVAVIVWELRTKHPVLDLRLFKNRNFAVSNAMMVVLGCVLLGTTVLLPQFLQLLLGYTAQRAGETLSLGGLTILVAMPVVGFLTSRVDARRLIAFGFVVTGLSLFYMASRLDLQIDFGTAVRLRVYQSIGMAFLFVPINAVAYVGVPREKSNDVSGMINFSRNVGASVGISLVATLLARRSQLHQTDLAAHVSRFDTGVSALLVRLQHVFGGLDPAREKRALAVIYQTVLAQAQTLAYVDVLRYLAVMTLCFVPFVFVLRKAKPGAAPAAH